MRRAEPERHVHVDARDALPFWTNVDPVGIEVPLAAEFASARKEISARVADPPPFPEGARLGMAATAGHLSNPSPGRGWASRKAATSRACSSLIDPT